MFDISFTTTVTNIWRLLSGQAEKEATQRNLKAHEMAWKFCGLHGSNGAHSNSNDSNDFDDFDPDPKGPTGMNGSHYDTRKL